MRLFGRMPRRIDRPVCFHVFCAWIPTLALVVQRSYAVAPPENLETDLARYGSAAEWRGVYYRSENIGFTVSQTIALNDGFEVQEHGRLQMSLLGAHNLVSVQTREQVDRTFGLRSFVFTLDPGS